MVEYMNAIMDEINMEVVSFFIAIISNFKDKLKLIRDKK